MIEDALTSLHNNFSFQITAIVRCHRKCSLVRPDVNKTTNVSLVKNAVRINAIRNRARDQRSNHKALATAFIRAHQVIEQRPGSLQNIHSYRVSYVYHDKDPNIAHFTSFIASYFFASILSAPMSNIAYDVRYLLLCIVSTATGVYCGNVKCGPYEKCGLNKSTKRQECVRS